VSGKGEKMSIFIFTETGGLFNFTENCQQELINLIKETGNRREAFRRFAAKRYGLTPEKVSYCFYKYVPRSSRLVNLPENDIYRKIFTPGELTLACNMARTIRNWIHEREKLGPYPRKDGKWFVAKGICNCCGGPLDDGTIHDSYDEAYKKAESIIDDMIKLEYDWMNYNVPNYGETCIDCQNFYKYCQELKDDYCNGPECEGNCVTCGVYRELDGF
jgi:hypothetical protein